MADQFLLNKWFDTEAAKQQSSVIQDEIRKYLELAKQAKPIVVGLSGDQKLGETIKAIESLGSLTKEQTNIANKAADAERKLADARAKDAKAAYDQAKASKTNNEERKQSVAVTVKEADALGKLNNAYEQLKRQYLIAANVAKQLAAEEIKLASAHGTSDEALKRAAKATLDAQKAAQAYFNQLVEVETKVGQSQRKVGDYAGSFKNLGNSVNQISRELPAFANSMQTGFLAISNNLPILFDALGQTRERIAELKAEGKQAPSLFQAFAGSVFSLGTALSVGVTLLTLYGPKLVDYIAGMFKSAEATEKARLQSKEYLEEQKRLNEVTKELTKAIIELGEASSKSYDTVIKGLKEQLAILQSTGVSQERQFALKSRITQAEMAQTDAIYQQAAAYAYQEQKSSALAKINADRNSGSIELINKRARIEQNTFDAEVNTENAIFLSRTSHYNEYLKLQSALTKETARVSKLNADDQKSAEGGLIILRGRVEQEKEVYNSLNTAITNSEAATSQAIQNANEEAKFSADQRRKLALETANIEAGIVKAKNEDILADERSTLTQRLAAMKAIANAQRSVIQAQKVNVLSDVGATDAERAIAVKKANEQLTELTISEERKRTDAIEKDRLKRLQADKNAAAAQIEVQASLEKELSENTLLGLETRLKYQQQFSENQVKLLNDDYKLKLQQAGISDEEITALQNNADYRVQSKKVTDEELKELQVKHETGILKLVTSTNAAITAIISSEIDKQQKIRTDSFGELERLLKSVDSFESVNVSNRIIALNEQFTQGKISAEKYAKEREKLEKEFNEKSLNNTISVLQQQLDLYKEAKNEEYKAKQKVESAKEQLTTATTDEEIKAATIAVANAEKELKNAEANTDKKIELEKKLADAKVALSTASSQKVIKDQESIKNAVINLYKETVNLFFDIAKGNIEREKNANQERLDGIDARKKKEIEAARAEAGSTEEKAAKVKLIEARAQGEREQIEARQRKLNLEKARFERLQTIAGIIQATAVNATKAGLNPITVALIIALGAVQLARVLATPLPKYEHGTLDAKGGDSLVGEKRPELIIEPSGKVWRTPGKPTVMDIPKHSIVLPDARKALAIAAMSGTPELLQMINVKNDNAGIERKLDSVVSAIKNKKELHQVVQGSVKSWVRSGNSWFNRLG